MRDIQALRAARDGDSRLEKGPLRFGLDAYSKN